MQGCNRRRKSRRRFSRRQRAVIAGKPLGSRGNLSAGRRVLRCNYSVPYGRHTDERYQPGDGNEALDLRSAFHGWRIHEHEDCHRGSGVATGVDDALLRVDDRWGYLAQSCASAGLAA